MEEKHLDFKLGFVSLETGLLDSVVVSGFFHSVYQAVYYSPY